MSTADIIGVRHYSPACARLVAARIRQTRPHTVLIEGPSDFNARIDELALPHTLPIAIYSYYGDALRTASCYAPLVEYAPEWAALDAARQIGARVRFMDLPYWHPGAQHLPQRYTLRTLPGRERYARVSALLQKHSGVEGEDALWDHLFERDADHIGVDAQHTAALHGQLQQYFDQLRGDEAGSASDQAREAHMRDWLRWASLQPGPVVVVCGGWHRPALRIGADPATAAELPDTPLLPNEPMLSPPPELTRHGSYLVPYREVQLDAYAGYGAGMPSPLWYRWQWLHGTAVAAHNCVSTIVQTLRQARQSLPTAQLVQARARILGLARLRGHPLPLRTDVLDGMLDVLSDSALDEPPPWTRRTPPGRATDARLRVALRALAGDGRGTLAPGTPQPPLVLEVETLLARLDLLVSAGPRQLTLDRRRHDDAQRASVLWRLRTLDIDGYALTAMSASGAARGLSADQQFEERWQLSAAQNQRAQLIEAGAWGATLAEAAARRIEDQSRDAAPQQLVDGVLAALRCDFVDLGTQLALAARATLGGCSDWTALSSAASRLAALADAGFWGLDLAPLLDPLLELLEQRLCWLIESRLGANAAADPADIDAVRFLAWCRARAPAQAARALGELLHRRALDDEAAPALRGAAAGALWQAAQAHDAFDEAAVIRAARRMPTAQVLGDWLIGLFALAREAVTSAPHLVGALDSLIEAQSDAEFLAALPALRQAFNWFPPRERAAIAELVAARHGHGSALAAALLSLPDDVAIAAQGAALQSRVRALMQRFALEEA